MHIRNMKKLSVLVAVIMTVTMAGCSLFESKYKKAEKKMIDAAVNSCDAAEMTAKQKKNVIKKNLVVGNTTFGDGAYVCLSSDDLEDVEIKDDTPIDSETVKHMVMFAKTSEKEIISSLVIEFSDKETASDFYDYYLEMIDFKSVKKQLRNADEAVVGVDDEDEDRFAYIVSMNGVTKAEYIRIDGRIVTASSFYGEDESDFLEEYYDFMREAGYTDMDVLLNGD